ncbi:MAG: NAD(+)/NADH kinase [Clostridia bacterium]|nr:NAD(+)/NADH kinase [Clostridia bacterium]
MKSSAIAFVIHPRRADAAETAERMKVGLEQAGFSIFYPQQGEARKDCHMVITFGGDGTLLLGAKTALEHTCPLLGINLGTLGFLTEGEPDRLNQAIQAISAGDYLLESRRMLCVCVNQEAKSYLALNDAVVTRGGFARLIQVETRVNQEHWSTFIADGVIAATPTGATGYSLSAGGPVIAPGVECMVITPVCAHSLQHCPCIVPTEAEVFFHLREGRDQLAQLQIDGQSMCTLQAGDTVKVTGAEESLQLVRFEDYHFFTVLDKKLNDWSRPREDQHL